jgi:hypothetical protein
MPFKDTEDVGDDPRNPTQKLSGQGQQGLPHCLQPIHEKDPPVSASIVGEGCADGSKFHLELMCDPGASRFRGRLAVNLTGKFREIQ